MEYTYDVNTSGCLIITCDMRERDVLADLIANHGTTAQAEAETLESLLANSELDWIQPEEIGALTSAPILGLRNENDEVEAAWGFMDYAVRSFLEDLRDTGKAVFIS